MTWQVILAHQQAAERALLRERQEGERQASGLYDGPGHPCANCGKREGTTQWVGSAGALAMTHGMWHWWCDVCVLTEQLRFARELVAKIPELVQRLGEANVAACEADGGHDWQDVAPAVGTGQWCRSCGLLRGTQA